MILLLSTQRCVSVCVRVRSVDVCVQYVAEHVRRFHMRPASPPQPQCINEIAVCIHHPQYVFADGSLEEETDPVDQCIFARVSSRQLGNKSSVMRRGAFFLSVRVCVIIPPPLNKTLT